MKHKGKNAMPKRKGPGAGTHSNHLVMGNEGPVTPTDTNKMPSKKSGMATAGSNHVQRLPAHQH